MIYNEWAWKWEELIVGGLPEEVEGSEVVKGPVLRIKHPHLQIQVLTTQHRELKKGRGEGMRDAWGGRRAKEMGGKRMRGKRVGEEGGGIGGGED